MPTIHSLVVKSNAPPNFFRIYTISSGMKKFYVTANQLIDTISNVISLAFGSRNIILSV